MSRREKRKKEKKGTGKEKNKRENRRPFVLPPYSVCRSTRWAERGEEGRAAKKEKRGGGEQGAILLVPVSPRIIAAWQEYRGEEGG